MAIDQTQKYCKTCKSVSLHSRPAPNHVLHLLITILICGLWIPVWILSAMRIGGWRCQRCGSKAGGGAIVLFAIIMVVIALPFCYRSGSDGIQSYREKQKPKIEDLPRPTKVNVKKNPESKPTPEKIEPSPEPIIRQKILAPEPVFLESLESIQLPVALKLIDQVSLLDATGKEVSLPMGTDILVEKRSATGTLSIRVGTKIFVGNETRIAKKFRLLPGK